MSPLAGIDPVALSEMMSSSQKGFLECLMFFQVVLFKEWQFLL